MVFDIAALVFILLVSIIMMMRGGIASILSLGGIVLSLIAASLLYPVVSDAVYETPLPEKLEEIVREAMIKAETGEETEELESVDAMPGLIQEAFDDMRQDAAAAVATPVAAAVTRVIINVIVFILVFVLTKLIVSLLFSILKLVSKLPVIHELDSLVGFACGLASSLVIVWLVVMLANVVATSNAVVAQWIDGSVVVKIMSSFSPF